MSGGLPSFTLNFLHRRGKPGGGVSLLPAGFRFGLTLQQIGDRVGGLVYKTVFARIKYLKNKLGKMHHYKRFMTNARTNSR